MEAKREASSALSINYDKLRRHRYIQSANFLVSKHHQKRSDWPTRHSFLFSRLLSLATLSLRNVRTPPPFGFRFAPSLVYFWSLELDPSRAAATSANATSWNACPLTNWLRGDEQDEKDKWCLVSLNFDENLDVYSI